MFENCTKSQPVRRGRHELKRSGVENLASSGIILLPFLYILLYTSLFLITFV